MGDKRAQLKINGLEIELPVYSPTAGLDVIDVAQLISYGYFTYDPGFLSTAMCDSSITYIDGDEGILRHRGYPIEQLAEHSNYLELCYLLLNRELPTTSQFEEFQNIIRAEQNPDPQIEAILSSFPQDSHPMGIMCTLVAAMSANYHAETDISNAEDRYRTAVRLIAKMPILAAMTYRHSQGKKFVPPKPELGYATNFLHMMFSDDENDAVDDVLANAMDRIFLLHADHEQNASTSTVRMAGSTDANPYAAIAAGIAALWGPSHGGANEAVLQMLDEIGDPGNIDAYVEKAKDRDDPFRIMGFGHRVYKNYDPRAKVLQETCHEVLNLLGVEDDPTLRMAIALERVALADEYFIERRLFPNVDFYSGIILKAMGIPTELFTVIFVIGRTPGWIAQWHEMVTEGYKISRPRQMYMGEDVRDYPT